MAGIYYWHIPTGTTQWERPSSHPPLPGQTESPALGDHKASPPRKHSQGSLSPLPTPDHEVRDTGTNSWSWPFVLFLFYLSVCRCSFGARNVFACILALTSLDYISLTVTYVSVCLSANSHAKRRSSSRLRLAPAAPPLTARWSPSPLWRPPSPLVDSSTAATS